MKGDTGKSDTKAWRPVRVLKQWIRPSQTSQGTWMGSMRIEKDRGRPWSKPDGEG